MKPEETFDFHIRWAWHKIAKLYNLNANQYDITMSIGYVLLNIDATNGTPSTSLGPKMGMEATSLSRTIKNMEQKGLITRKPDAFDKRMVRLFLTDLGLEIREQSKQAVIQFNQGLSAFLSPKEQAAFFGVLPKINEYLESQIQQLNTTTNEQND